MQYSDQDRAGTVSIGRKLHEMKSAEILVCSGSVRCSGAMGEASNDGSNTAQGHQPKRYCARIQTLFIQREFLLRTSQEPYSPSALRAAKKAVASTAICICGHTSAGHDKIMQEAHNLLSALTNLRVTRLGRRCVQIRSDRLPVRQTSLEASYPERSHTG